MEKVQRYLVEVARTEQAAFKVVNERRSIAASSDGREVGQFVQDHLVEEVFATGTPRVETLSLRGEVVHRRLEPLAAPSCRACHERGRRADAPLAVLELRLADSRVQRGSGSPREDPSRIQTIMDCGMTRLLTAARESAARLVRARPAAAEIQGLGQTLARETLGGDGALWIMDSEGTLLFHTEPRFRDEFLSRRRSFGNIILVPDHLAPRPPQAGALFKVRLRDVASTYEEGCGTVRQYGVKRSLAFSKAQGLNLVVGVESPSAQ